MRLLRLLLQEVQGEVQEAQEEQEVHRLQAQEAQGEVQAPHQEAQAEAQAPHQEVQGEAQEHLQLEVHQNPAGLVEEQVEEEMWAGEEL